MEWEGYPTPPENQQDISKGCQSLLTFQEWSWQSCTTSSKIITISCSHCMMACLANPHLLQSHSRMGKVCLLHFDNNLGPTGQQLCVEPVKMTKENFKALSKSSEISIFMADYKVSWMPWKVYQVIPATQTISILISLHHCNLSSSMMLIQMTLASQSLQQCHVMTMWNYLVCTSLACILMLLMPLKAGMDTSPQHVKILSRRHLSPSWGKLHYALQPWGTRNKWHQKVAITVCLTLIVLCDGILKPGVLITDDVVVGMTLEAFGLIAGWSSQQRSPNHFSTYPWYVQCHLCQQ